MSYEDNPSHLPSCDSFAENIAILNLPISCSELHGVMCGYLCAGAFHEGEIYLRALMVKFEKNATTRVAAKALFDVYEISKHQISTMDFGFQLLLPEDQAPLMERAEAFSEWCEGFTQGITLAGIDYEELEEEDSQEALEHLFEFAQLDYEGLDIEEEDEKALMEVNEYARMAVLRLSGDIKANKSGGEFSDTTH
ncbi:MAG: UPF0149 family protein [Legionella sp.]|nr:UPF0149 family protein [Legionella sp.]